MNTTKPPIMAIFTGLTLGIIVGEFLHDPSWDSSLPLHVHAHASWLSVFEFVGFTVFMGLLKMLIVPLIAVSVTVGICSIGDFRKLGKLGAYTLLYYITTMVIAVSIGLAFVSLLKPGDGIEFSAERALTASSSPEALNAASGGLLGAFRNLVSLMIPENIFAAMSQGQTLPIIVFFIFFGIVFASCGERAILIKQVFDALFAVIMRMVEIVLSIAPIGVFCLLAWSIARIGLGVFGEAIGLYMLTVNPVSKAKTVKKGPGWSN